MADHMQDTTTVVSPSGLIIANTTFTVLSVVGAGTYVPPAGVIQLIVRACGGGGGGGGAKVGADRCGAGAGAAGYLEALITTVAASYAYTVGAAGAGGSNAGGDGTAGGNTVFGTETAGGGSGGQGAPGGAVARSGGAGGTNTTTTLAYLDVAGQGGMDSFVAATGTVESFAGGGGSGALGSGGQMNAITPGAGMAATGAGAGGGGGVGAGANGNVGGAGSPGLIIVTEFR